jgi:hypothetical protein
MSGATYRTCTRCSRCLALNEENFYRSRKSKSGFQGRCKQCNCDGNRERRNGRGRGRGQVVRADTGEPRRRQEICPVCASLAHRRPESGCPKCKKPYVPLSPITVASALEQRTPDRRVTL